MGEANRKMFGDGQYPYPLDQFLKSIQLYSSPEMCIIVPKSGISFLERGQHVHDSYEFIIPSSVMPYLSYEKKCHVGEKNRVIPFNSGQSHGPADRMLNTRFTALMIDSNFLNETACSIYRKSGVAFKNGNYVFGSNLDILIRLFIEESGNQQPGQKFILQSLASQIVVNLLRRIDNNMPVSMSSGMDAGKKNIDRAIEYLREQYNHDYSLEDVSKVANLSPYHFIRVFKTHTGKSPYEYLLDIKIERARELLISEKVSVTEVCFRCGFNNISHFTTFFKKKVGVTPSQYRKIVSGH